MKGKIGIIGGSGMNKASLFSQRQEVAVTTPWGEPSGPILEGEIGGIPVALMTRHGSEHTIPPAQVNYRANIQALADAGCSCILATTAVGSLRAEIGRGDLVILDQFIDFTRQRRMTYFEQFAPHAPQHTPMADPFHEGMRGVLYAMAQDLGLTCHPRGTVITIEGPRFSTRAESRMFRGWGGDVINMSIATEAILANERGIPYAAVAMSTDYDSWNDEAEPVSWEQILEVFGENVDKVTRLLEVAVPKVAALWG